MVNSIHAIEEAGGATEGQISIRIKRTPSQALLDGDEKGRRPQSEITDFEITDNGVGFDQENYQAFLTLDTDHKAARGGRGIGRLLWLKAFKKVEITSAFRDSGGLLVERVFTFDVSGVSLISLRPAADGTPRRTTVRLIGFDPRYRAAAFKTGESIADSVLEHCLWYFVRPGGTPHITVEDNRELILLSELFERHMHSSAERDLITIKATKFELLHVKLRASSTTQHSVAYCADDRLVLEERLSGQVPGLHGPLSDSAGAFTYICYVSSKILDERVRPERSAFDIPVDSGELFSATELSWKDIRAAIAARAASHLSQYLQGVRERARERVHQFIAHKAPRYKPIEGQILVEQLDIAPEISDRDLELTLHRHLAEIERQLLSEGHDLMAPREGEDAEGYKKRLSDYLDRLETVKMSDLASYVAHRRVVIDLLDAAIQRQADGSYAREDLIHTLIMPMRRDSTQVGMDGSNLWLLDERLAFHDYLASDKALTAVPITGAKGTQEPDILALNVFDNPVLVAEGASLPLASLVIIEIKRPMRDIADHPDEDPIEQALRYLERVRDGKVRTATGRPISGSEEVPGFCYILCDLTPSMIKRCKMHDLTRTQDGMGYFAYKNNYKAYVEVISFDRLVTMATQRNRAFFDKLGLPTS